MLNYYCDLWDYIFEPLNDARKFKFLDLIKDISWEKICDVWCGYSWLFWALWYFERVNEIYFYEFYDAYLNKLNFYIDNISPEFLEENFSEVITFLQNNNLIDKNKTYSDIAQELLEKVIWVEKIDFLQEIPWNDFDVIFANESIECVQWNDIFLGVLKNIYDSLVIWWKLYFIMLWYDTKNSTTQELIDLKLEWTIQITIENIWNLLVQWWFNCNYLKNKTFKELWNRWTYLYWKFIKK